MPRPQFRLRSLFNLTAIVAMGCLVGPPLVLSASAAHPHSSTLLKHYLPVRRLMVTSEFSSGLPRPEARRYLVPV